ncbi:chemotaxis protein CheA [Shewanella fidelis]|uniref:Chemotaxis protein CheA n=1 Tax=Shewanella fidelis TaxID=173509 RepID=A0AAW8NQ07_9GAMM|nr:chemotaxis protein CheA [Shewanella fidelis]MDR8524450.1 chemotaxis protein CheA [Shewanella fidelis]MDW4811926.1 chemotaxis protein CheA [Shewanella fidelis]MDW4817135.1 chemotaxis protein CheA [Shewanella fidelis]MDW4821205.1 chemotaxis protein CheA [Shewanella fidelis]MDW4822532.1 chemotaxis protein CheA [Shewanella fidelis]
MSFDVDEEILQDFLIEAGEILELLQEQLVALENNPDDTDLLNAIFRGFHTVKGGAGFLGLSPMVDVCHEAENTFDLLRTGKRSVTANLMDVILQAVDSINSMFAETQAGQPQSPAEPTLLAQLKTLSAGELLASELAQPSAVEPIAAEVPSEPAPVTEAPKAEETPIEAAAETSAGSIDDIDEAEFEALLDALHGAGNGPGASATSESISAANSSSDDITDDEFESLLDELHGSGQFKTPETASTSTSSLASVEPTTNDVDSDEITDDEFERLLDELHGSGAGPGSANQGGSVTAISSTNTAQTDNPATVVQAITTSQQAEPQETVQPAAVAAPQPQPVAKAAPKPASSNMPQAETTVRVDTSRLDQIMNMVGELVLVRNRLLSLGVAREDEEMSKALANLDLVTADLQGAVMKTRMQPIKKVFGRFPRVVRDLARTLNKEIDLVMVGEDTDLDKNLVEALADPLVHLVRNSVDHGIEMPDIREANGKQRTGTITLSASQEGDHILLKIEDDGAGMDPEKLKSIAISRGVLDEDSAARMTDEEAYNLIFAPGFSTKVEISDISGRGVGMDVVKTRITQLNGSVYIDSQQGKGTRLEIKVPLTLAIMPTLMVEVAEQVFALPLSSVNEIFHLDLTKTNVVDGQLTVIVRDKAVPLFYLEQWLSRKSGFSHGDKQHGHVVIVQLGTMQIGFVVDSLIGQEEVVIKPLGTLLHGTPGMAGATITSDGGIALILDVPGLLKYYARNKS